MQPSCPPPTSSVAKGKAATAACKEILKALCTVVVETLRATTGIESRAPRYAPPCTPPGTNSSSAASCSNSALDAPCLIARCSSCWLVDSSTCGSGTDRQHARIQGTSRSGHFSPPNCATPQRRRTRATGTKHSLAHTMSCSAAPRMLRAAALCCAPERESRASPARCRAADSCRAMKQAWAHDEITRWHATVVDSALGLSSETQVEKAASPAADASRLDATRCPHRARSLNSATGHGVCAVARMM